MAQKATTISPTLATKNAEALEKLHQLGKASLNRCPQEALEYGETSDRLEEERNILARDAQKQGLVLKINKYTVARMRRVAEYYTADQIKDLTKQIRISNSRFSPTHLLRVVSVEKSKPRDQIVTKAIKRSWTYVTLYRHVQLELPRRKWGSGRAPLVPAEVKEQLVLLESLATRWLRCTEAASEDLPEPVLKAMTKANSAMSDVKDAVSQSIDHDFPKRQRSSRS